MISGLPTYPFALALSLILGSCSNPGNKKAENTNREATSKDSASNASGGLEKTTENTVHGQESTPATDKEKNDIKPSGTGATTSKPGKNENTETPQSAKTETGKDKSTAEQPQSDPVSPAKPLPEKEEPKGNTLPLPVPKPEPVAEKPKEVIVVPPVRENTNEPAPAPGQWVVPANDKNKPNPVKADAESLSIGKSLYIKHCASCHGKNGLGDGPKAANLDTPCADFGLPATQNQTDGALFYKIRTGKDDMPAFRKKLPDEEDIWSIVNYIRTFK